MVSTLALIPGALGSSTAAWRSACNAATSVSRASAMVVTGAREGLYGRPWTCSRAKPFRTALAAMPPTCTRVARLRGARPHLPSPPTHPLPCVRRLEGSGITSVKPGWTGSRVLCGHFGTASDHPAVYSFMRHPIYRRLETTVACWTAVFHDWPGRWDLGSSQEDMGIVGSSSAVRTRAM